MLLLWHSTIRFWSVVLNHLKDFEIQLKKKWSLIFRPRHIIVHNRPSTTIHYHYYIRPSYLPPYLPRGCGGRCGRNAFCWRGHTCVCRHGYKGNPMKRCYPGIFYKQFYVILFVNQNLIWKKFFTLKVLVLLWTKLRVYIKDIFLIWHATSDFSQN